MSDLRLDYREVKAVGCFVVVVFAAVVATLMLVVFLVGRWTA